MPMSMERSFAILAALFFCSSGANAASQGSADIIDSVEVTARREAMRDAIRAFDANVTRFDGEHVARWR